MSDRYTWSVRDIRSPEPTTLVNIVTRLVDDQDDEEVMFTRGGGTRHQCPVCSNARDLSRMSVYTPNAQSAHIYWCPKGHIYMACAGNIVPFWSFRSPVYCPICGDVQLILDTEGLMEQYAESWEHQLAVMHPDQIPYKCDQCGEAGPYEDLRMTAEASNDHQA